MSAYLSFRWKIACIKNIDISLPLRLFCKDCLKLRIHPKNGNLKSFVLSNALLSRNKKLLGGGPEVYVLDNGNLLNSKNFPFLSLFSSGLACSDVFSSENVVSNGIANSRRKNTAVGLIVLKNATFHEVMASRAILRSEKCNKN